MEYVFRGQGHIELPIGERSLKAFVNIFAPAFFLASWGISQWFRVKKQQKIDNGLTSIETAVNRSLTNLETRTNEVISNVTGGDSACYLFGPTPDSDVWSGLLIIHVGNYPLYEVSARIADIDVFQEMLKNNEPLTLNDRGEQSFCIGTLAPIMAQYAKFVLPLGPGDNRRFNLFFTARNGSTTQLLRCKKVDGQWKFATKLQRNDRVLFEKIDEDYPVSSNGEVDWD